MVSKLLSWTDYSFITVAAIGEVMDILWRKFSFKFLAESPHGQRQSWVFDNLPDSIRHQYTKTTI